MFRGEEFLPSQLGRQERLADKEGRVEQNEANWNCASTDFGVWLERRAKLDSIVELDTARIITKILAFQLKLSRYAGEDKHCTHLMLI